MITIIASCIPLLTSVILFFLNRQAQKEDCKSQTDSEQEKRISEIEKELEVQRNEIKELGANINDSAKIQKMTVDGLAYIVDGLETAKIMNGTGKKYLRDIQKFYSDKGFESLKFHSLTKTKKQ